MRDKALLHSVPIVPNPNFAGDFPRDYEEWTVPSVDDLARNRPPVYMPRRQPVPKELRDSPWLHNLRNELPSGPGARSQAPGEVSSQSSQLSSAPALAALATLSHAQGSHGPSAPATSLAGPAVLFGLGASPQVRDSGERTGSGGLLDLLAQLMAATPNNPSR
jgi:hypothetical protein